MTIADWRTLSDEDRALAYSPSSCIDGDLADELQAYSDLSDKAVQRCREVGATFYQFRYGQAEAQSIDAVVPADADDSVPLLIYIHGGYWQELSKKQSLFSAADCLGHRIAFAAVGYTLAPDASLDQIVGECRSAVTLLRNKASSIGVDADQIFIAGSSAGAQLAAMLGLGWPKSSEQSEIQPEDEWRPAGLGLISGIFDLEPLIGTYINDALQLDPTAARRNSPLFAALERFPTCVIAYGENETAEFKRQSEEMCSALRSHDVGVRSLEAQNRNHFNIILDLCQAETELGQAMLDLVQNPRPR